jgi:hypothetical protein
MASQLEIQPVEQEQPDRVAAFAERMVGIVNDGCLALMISVGHRTGLFETMAGRAPSTTVEIAEAGLGRVDVSEIEGDIQNLYYRARPA